MRNDRPSLTATLVAAARAFYAQMPEPYLVAPDAEARDLLPLPLALPAALLERVPRAGPRAHRILGAGLGGVTYHVALRTRAIDDALRDAMHGGARQLVLLGAGLDNRGRRLPELAGVRVLEVDHPAMQRWRRERLAARGAEPPTSTAVPVDFERDRLDTALIAAGLSKEEPSFWIWEGVTVYLTPEAIDETLATIAALSAPGSRLAMTYSEPDSLTPPLMQLLQGVANLIGEPVRGAMTRAQAAARLRRVGLEALSDEAAIDWAGRYWNESPPGIREWERLVVAERRP